MKNYTSKWLVRILGVALFSVATGFFLFFQLYRVSILCAAITCVFIYRLFIFQERTVKDMKRLIEAIRFSEFNISFKSFSGKGLAPELIPDMEASIERFNAKLRKMEAEQHFYDSLLNRIDFGIIVIDKSLKINWINKAALDMSGKPQPRILDDLKSVSPDLPETLNRLIPRETKIIRIEREKAVHQLAVTAIYFILEGKELKLISLKNIQSVLEESESDAWKKLIRVLTHEIMNSLTPIISLSETFSEGNEENREWMTRAMQTIHRRSKGLVDFVSNYKKLTHIPQPVILPFPAREWMDDIKRLLKADGFIFTYAIQPQYIIIEADRGLMEQVLINLIKNACESSPPDKPVTVTVGIFQNEYRRPVIQVSDTGEGILPDVMDKIFVPFFTTKTSGSGIGLSICRQIVNLHGGTISVQSEPEKGSCFTIQL
ncbi:MAG: PAS domain-containing sensor histidine kinase [Candidatus Symbiothrix sp.]|jgi:nitrogen fixation/metabolism regulation signal transduction histidine kinase|nr:PAS domain-containing sensor histidine kinase [Candidatus Symbiothrix sp.]